MPGKTLTRTAVVEAVLFLLLTVGGGLLLWGSHFANNMVHDQLTAQKIAFPPKGSPGLEPKTFPGLQRYAGQSVDNGPKAKAYANEFIAVHLRGVAAGKTYAEVSSAALKAPTDTKLAGQVQTLFRGETLRGLLLYAWGWSVVAHIAGWTAYAGFAGALVVLAALLFGLFSTEAAAEVETAGRSRRSAQPATA